MLMRPTVRHLLTFPKPTVPYLLIYPIRISAEAMICASGYCRPTFSIFRPSYSKYIFHLTEMKRIRVKIYQNPAQ